LSPAASITSWPSSAGFLLPETGASRKSPPFALIACRKQADLSVAIYMKGPFSNSI